MADCAPPPTGPGDPLDPDRLAALAEFAAGAGHEINNPLATIIGRAQQLLRDEPDPNRQQLLETIAAQAYRIRDMIGDVMLFARPPRPEVESLPVTEVIESVMARFADEAAALGWLIQIDLEAGLSISADRTQFCVVLSELLRNSFDALRMQGGSLRIITRAANPFCEITVSDTGRGLTETERRHLFDPFFSGRQAGRGLGFGLPKCWRIVTNHGGRIELDSAAGGPTSFRVYWPLVQDNAD